MAVRSVAYGIVLLRLRAELRKNGEIRRLKLKGKIKRQKHARERDTQTEIHKGNGIEKERKTENKSPKDITRSAIGCSAKARCRQGSGFDRE